ncbi:MAG: diacylglycerol kinase family protein [Bacteroidota bacterium]|jgi:diacylglycerol kinase (ATP)|nr:diacylglycerol kinase family protein [Bacteroidota bacterium]
MRVLKSFLVAFEGLKDCFLHEKNFQVQFTIAILVTAAGIYFSISSMEWIILLICFAVVLSFEIINSAIEKLCNMVCSDYNLSIKKIKDMSASAVLFSAIISFIIGCIIFLPKIKMFLALMSSK